ncbi:DUF4468 domain-containing protein [Paenimyroides ceti]
MKKQLFLLLLSFITIQNILAQELPYAKLTKNGIEPIVVEVGNKTKEEIFKSINEYLQVNYKNPNYVQKGNIENEYIRWEGYKENAWGYKTLGITTYYDMTYVIEIDIKDNKYKYSYRIVDFYSSGKKALFGISALFNSEGEVRKVYKNSVPEIEENINSLNAGIYEYIIKGNQRNNNW